MSFLFWLLYASKAARKIASKSVEVDDTAAGVLGTWCWLRELVGCLENDGMIALGGKRP